MLFGKQEWNSQPQIATGIDWSNPITRGLLYAINPASPSFDCVSGKSIALSGSAGFSPGGIVRSQSGSQNAFTIADDAASRPANITQWARLRRTGTVTSYNDVVGKAWQTNTSPTYVSFSVSYNKGATGQNYITANQGVSGNIISTANYLHPDTTQWHDIAETCGGNVALYVGGVLRSSVSSGAIVYGASGNNDFKTNTNTLASSPFDFGPIFVWSRVLSATEIASLTANPWQIFTPRLA